MKILIPNGTSAKNIGDLAILTALVGLIKKSGTQTRIALHSTDPHLHHFKNIERVEETLYSYVAFEHAAIFTRVFRLTKLAVYYILLRFNLLDSVVSPNDQLYLILNDYRQTDTIIFTGGGYLRSKPGLTQSLNLLMQLMMLHIGSLLGNRKIVAPISFGPFAYNWQEKLTACVLKNFDLVTIREDISFNKLLLYKLTNLKLSTDLGLLLPPQKLKKKTSPTIGFTICPWFTHTQKQKYLESVYAQVLSNFANKYQMAIQPIVQVWAPDFARENDAPVVERVYQALKQKGLNVHKPKYSADLKDAQSIYGSLDLLLGMRMHSNILTAIQGIPFVAVAYEHKTVGLARTLKMLQFCIEAEKISASKLFQKLESAHKNRIKIKKILAQKLKAIQKKEIPFWKKLI